MPAEPAQKADARAQRLHDVDNHIGARIRLYRNALGLSQTRLAEALGVSYQQLQKYEHGEARVSAQMLLGLAQALGIPLNAFFDGIAHDGPADAASEHPIPLRRETLELVRAYYRVSDPVRRRSVLALIQSMASNPN